MSPLKINHDVILRFMTSQYATSREWVLHVNWSPTPRDSVFEYKTIEIIFSIANRLATMCNQKFWFLRLSDDIMQSITLFLTIYEPKASRAITFAIASHPV